MADESQTSSVQNLPVQPMAPHPSILNRTLGELLQNNSTAQNMVMSAMQITPQQFQQLLQMTGSNQLMNQTIGDLFKNGTMTQAAGQAVQLNPQQVQQLLGVLASQNTSGQQTGTTQAIQSGNPGNTIPYTLPASPAKPSLLQKLKSFFR